MTEIDHRSPEPRPLAGARRSRRRLRHPRWRDPPGVRPAHGLHEVRHILVRHEQGAGHAAEGYAQATGRVGVCMATSGPGATNLVTPIADAYMDSVPIVAITGQVPSASIGTDAFQEADIRGITMPITKHNYLVTDPAEIPRAIAEAFHIAGTGRPGPGARRHREGRAAGARPRSSGPTQIDLPGYRPVDAPARQADARGRAADRRGQAAGALRRRRRHQVRTRRARAAAPRRAHRHPGRHHADGARRVPRQPPAAPRHARACTASVAAVGALQKSDLHHRARRPLRRPRHRPPRLVRARRAGDPRRHRPRGDLQEPRRPTSRSWATPREVITDLIAAIAAEHEAGHIGRLRRVGRPARPHEGDLPAGLRRARPTARSRRSTSSSGSARSPARRRSTPPASASTRCGPRSSSTTSSPGTWLNSGGAGTMGYAVPAAMGAKVGRPDATVWAIDGDGCFQMTNQELATCAINDIPIKVALINNSSPGHGPPVADAVLRVALLQHRPAQPPHPRLREARGRLRLPRPALRDAATTSTRRSRRRWRIERRARSSSTSWCTRTPWCGRWSPPARATTTSRSRATSRPLGPRGVRTMSRHTLSVLVEDQPGVLARISGAVLPPRLQHRVARGRPHRASPASRA